VHVSFVRSISMDKWKDIELEKMKVGGNQKAREFFDSMDDWDDTLPIERRYNSKAAALYKDKIATIAAGKPWDPKTSPAQNYDATKFQNSSREHTTSYQAGNVHDEKEAFFARIQMENSMKPDDLPPSQGGKYTGFGNTVERVNNPPINNLNLSTDNLRLFADKGISSLTSGWSVFSSSALKIASKATENAVKFGGIASQKVVDISATVTDKVNDISRKGWQDIAGATFPTHVTPQLGSQADSAAAGDYANNWEEFTPNTNTTTQNVSSPDDSPKHEKAIQSKHHKQVNVQDDIVDNYEQIKVKNIPKPTKKDEEDAWNMLMD